MSTFVENVRLVGHIPFNVAILWASAGGRGRSHAFTYINADAAHACSSLWMCVCCELTVIEPFGQRRGALYCLCSLAAQPPLYVSRCIYYKQYKHYLLLLTCSQHIFFDSQILSLVFLLFDYILMCFRIPYSPHTQVLPSSLRYKFIRIRCYCNGNRPI